jgi:RNA polymerase sigma-70 factor (ECF subfamily)
VKQDAPLRDADKAPAWLYKLAVRQSLLYRRRCGRRRKRLLRLAGWRRGEAAGNGQAGPLDWLLAAERREHVRAALQRLPGRDGDLLLLKYGEGWSYKQIAEHLDMTESAVESRLHRARARLRGELESMRMDGET